MIKQITTAQAQSIFGQAPIDALLADTDVLSVQYGVSEGHKDHDPAAGSVYGQMLYAECRVKGANDAWPAVWNGEAIGWDFL